MSSLEDTRTKKIILINKHTNTNKKTWMNMHRQKQYIFLITKFWGGFMIFFKNKIVYKDDSQLCYERYDRMIWYTILWNMCVKWL